MTVELGWRGGFASREVNRLHAEAFDTRVFADAEWDWLALVRKHSLGWVTAREAGRLVGFVNVIGDGLVHAWLQDLMVAGAARRRGIGERLVAEAAGQASAAGCEWLHVDFGSELSEFYYRACGFTPTSAGIMPLR